MVFAEGSTEFALEDLPRDRILVAHAGTDAQTAAIVRALVLELEHRAGTSEVPAFEAGSAPPPHDFRAVAIVSPVRFGRFARSAIEYVVEHAAALARIPGFVIGFSRERRGVRRAFEHLMRSSRWQPTLSVSLERAGWFGDPRSVPALQIHELARSIAS